ncbi:hypothetical protein ACHAXT_004688 [Thalassiosira profunda]
MKEPPAFMHSPRRHIALGLFLMAAACAHGFLLGTRSPLWPRRRSGPTLSQTELGEEYANVVYPTDTLQNIGINTTLTLAPDIAYFYLQNTLGLSEEAMWKITLEAGSVLGMTPRNLEKKVSLLRRTMNLSDEDVRVILGKQPAVLHYSAERNLAPTILFLVRALDLSKSELRELIMECPSILSYSLSNLGKKIAFFRALGFSDDEDGKESLRELLLATPKLLLSAVDTGLEPRVKFLHHEIQFSLDELRVLYTKNPRLLLYSLDDNLREKIVFFFILQLHMEPEQVQRVLLSYPQVMDYNLENHLKPIAEYFLSDLEFSSSELGQIVLKFPRVFSYALFRIKHVTGFLRYELGLDGRQVKRVLFQAPQVLGLSEDSLKEKLDFLSDRLHLSADELGEVFSKMPTLICLGLESNLRPKIEYLQQALKEQDDADDELLKGVILKQPTLLGYSLQGRIQPRMEQLVAAGISPSKITVGISMTEQNFQQWLASSQSKSKRHATADGTKSAELNAVLQDLEFSENEAKAICNTVSPGTSLSAWASYLKEELGGSGTELKQVLISHPVLLDGSSRRRVRRRIKQLRTAGLPVRDNLDAIDWTDDTFDEWIASSATKIGYMQRTLGLNAIEIDELLSQLPSLASTKANKAFQRKLSYLMTELGNSTEIVKTLVLDRPSILDLSMKQVVESRVQKARKAGVSGPRALSDLIAMTGDDFRDNITLLALESHFSDTAVVLKARLQLDQNETDSLLPYLSNDLASKQRAERLVSFLLGLTDDNVGQARAAVLKQPHLLSHSLDELLERADELQLHTTNDIIEILAMTDREYDAYAAFGLLQKTLNFTANEMNSLAEGSGGMVWQNSTLSAKIEHLLSQGSADDAKNAILSRPKLLSQPLQRLQSASNVLNAKRSKHASLRFGNESETMLRDVLGLSEGDAKLLLSQSRNLALRDPEAFLAPKLSYLLSVFDGSKTDTASCILANPGLLDNSLESWIVPRMKVLIDAGLDPSQINAVGRQSPEELEQIIEYLQYHAFQGSTQKLKETIRKDPALLKQSLQTLQQTIPFRLEAMQLLEAAGLDFRPSDRFFTQSESALAKELLPTAQSWYPGKSAEARESEEDGTDGTIKRKKALATLRDFPSTLPFAYADDPNREAARVVHWR